MVTPSPDLVRLCQGWMSSRGQPKHTPRAIMGEIFIIDNEDPRHIFNIVVQNTGSTFPSPTSTFIPEDNL